MKRMKTLKSWRAARGFSQQRAADFLGITQSEYSKLELGTNAPRPKRGKAISEKTGVPFETVMGVA